ncbi:MAG: ATP-binding protein, partial [Leptospira sp.]|nr:ATP-binding protein [Leptospira sp.]
EKWSGDADKSAQKVGEFAEIEIPLTIREYLTWMAIEHFVAAGFGLLFVASLLFTARVIMRRIINAADATKNIGTINIQTYSKDDKVHLEITDDGEGMTEETKSKIFDPYFTTKELGKGTGLGMFVVKQIVDAFEIALEIESKVGVGSKFHFSFHKVRI